MTPVLVVVSTNPVPPYCAAIPAMSRKFPSLARIGVVIACCARACVTASQNMAGVALSNMRRMTAPRGGDAAVGVLLAHGCCVELVRTWSRNKIREALRAQQPCEFARRSIAYGRLTNRQR